LNTNSPDPRTTLNTNSPAPITIYSIDSWKNKQMGLYSQTLNTYNQLNFILNNTDENNIKFL
jgi:hypothetical protein